MGLQIIKDGLGHFIPIDAWKLMTQKYRDLEDMIGSNENRKDVDLSNLTGKLSAETAHNLINYVNHSRNEWEERLTNPRQ